MTYRYTFSVRPNQDFYRTTEPNRTRIFFAEPNRTEPNQVVPKHPYFAQKQNIF